MLPLTLHTSNGDIQIDTNDIHKRSCLATTMHGRLVVVVQDGAYIDIQPCPVAWELA